MQLRRLSKLILFIVLDSSCFAQGKFFAGSRFGAGGSVAPMHALLEADGSVYPVYAGTTLSTGLVLSYIIGDRFGFESGLLVTHYSYYRDDHHFRRRLFKGAAEMELADSRFHWFSYTSHVFRKTPTPRRIEVGCRS